jgi:hypothetical protein
MPISYTKEESVLGCSQDSWGVSLVMVLHRGAYYSTCTGLLGRAPHPAYVFAATVFPLDKQALVTQALATPLWCCCLPQVRAIAAELAAEQEAHAAEVRARQEVEQERDEARR